MAKQGKDERNCEHIGNFKTLRGLTMLKQIKPFLNVGPGDFIKEELEYRNWSQEDLSEILGISLKSVNHLINHKQTITLDMARLLGKVFGQSPQYWINLDSNYRLREHVENNLVRDIEIKSIIYKYMPIKEMMKRKWICNVRNVDSLVKAVMDFWEIQAFDFKFLDIRVGLHFRKSETFMQFNAYYALNWFQMARKASRFYPINAFKKDGLKEIISKYSKYTVEENGIQSIIKDLNDSGVKFLVLQHLQKTYIDGASFFEDSNPVIVYSPRYDRVDHFWFTLAHEIAHVMNDIKEPGQFIIDNVYEAPTEAKEKKANQFACDLLKMNEIKKYFEKYHAYISEFRVKACAMKLLIDESVVVGTLQHYKFLSTRNLNR
jgi:HTH-type transcriptional regulator/antitoxin HigA